MSSSQETLSAQQTRMLTRVRRSLGRLYPELAVCPYSFAMTPDMPPTDVIFLFANDSFPPPETLFSRLRWGGQLVLLSPTPTRLAEPHSQLRKHGGFLVNSSLAPFRMTFFGLPNPFAAPLHYLIARKTLLIPPGASSDRFTYHVELVRNDRFGPEFVVMKQVPTVERVLSRLREKFPDTPQEDLVRRAKKFTEKIFPLFLTREAAILRILQEKLPEHLRRRVPCALAVEKDANGFVRTLYMNWLRHGTPPTGPLSQLEFAKQATSLLQALHDTARIIHLDLRLDNFVITQHGVGFVDFGSAVRIGESLHESNLLTNLFEEMMRTSQIQRMLGRMRESGQVTSADIRNSYQKVDKAIDYFYLAVQINSPLANPDFRGLVRFEPQSEEARQLAALTHDILRPENPDNPLFRSAQDILNGILEIERSLPPASRRFTPPPSPPASVCQSPMTPVTPLTQQTSNTTDSDENRAGG